MTSENKEKPDTEECRDEETEISRLFGTRQKCIHRCLKCNEEVITNSLIARNISRTPFLYYSFLQKIKTNILLVCNLLLGQNNREAEYLSFSQVLRKYLFI